EEEDPLLPAGLPESPDDLKGGVGLARACRHHEQHAVLALGDRLDYRVDRVLLVVTRALPAAVVVVVLQHDGLSLICNALPEAVPLPERGRCREGAETERTLDLA